MAENIKVSFTDFPEVNSTIEFPDLIENKEMTSGGLEDIIKYICTELVDSYDGIDTDEDPFLEKLYLSGYKDGDEDKDFEKANWCSYFIEVIFDDNAVVGIEEEARFIVSMVFSYYQKRKFALMENQLLAILEEEGLTEDEVNNPGQLAVNIVKSHYSKTGPYNDVIEYTMTYIKSYYNAKNDFIIEATVVDAEKYFKSGNFSGQKRKKILRALGASKQQVQQIKNNWNEIDDFLNTKKLDLSYKNDFKKAYKLNKELKPLINNDLNKAKEMVRKGEFIEEFQKKAFWKRTKSGLVLVDMVLSLKDAHDKEKMMDNLTSGIGGCFGAGMGFAVSAFLAVGDDYWSRNMKELNDDRIVACGIVGYEILDSKSGELNFPENKYLMLQYKKEEDEAYKNSEYPHTSIKISSGEVAERIFGFKPSFINYYSPKTPKNICRTRCY